MVWHDRRLAGNPPRIAPNIYNVDASVAIDHALGWIATYAKKNSGLTDLYIMCHGYEAGIEDEQNQMSRGALGFGLQLCKEGLTLSNVGKTASWKGLVQRITNTDSTQRGSWGDGGRFCGELALHTGAVVVASSATQYYNHEDRGMLWWKREDEIDFGAWEGSVYEFLPDGTKHLR
jgi:hypothetical protein